MGRKSAANFARLTAVKFTGGWAKCIGQFYELGLQGLESNLLYKLFRVLKRSVERC